MLVNQLTSANLESLLLYDRDLFANMVVPMGMEKQWWYRRSGASTALHLCTTLTRSG